MKTLISWYFYLCFGLVKDVAQDQEGLARHTRSWYFLTQSKLVLSAINTLEFCSLSRGKQSLFKFWYSFFPFQSADFKGRRWCKSQHIRKCSPFLEYLQLKTVFPRSPKESSSLLFFLRIIEPCNRKGVASRPLLLPSPIGRWGVLCKGYITPGQKWWQTPLWREFSNQWEDPSMYSMCLAFLGFKFVGGDFFFHVSLVPNVFPLCSTWVPNKFLWGFSSSLCVPQHVLHSTSLLSHILEQNVVLFSPTYVGHRGRIQRRKMGFFF